MKPDDKLNVIKEDGGILGPADRESILRWASDGSIHVDDELELADGRRMSVMADDEIRVRLETASAAEMRHPGRRDLLIGGLMSGVAAVLMIGSVVAPKAMNLVPGHGSHSVNQVYWWLGLGVLGLGGCTLLIHGLRERKRAQKRERLMTVKSH